MNFQFYFSLIAATMPYICIYLQEIIQSRSLSTSIEGDVTNLFISKQIGSTPARYKFNLTFLQYICWNIEVKKKSSF